MKIKKCQIRKAEDEDKTIKTTKKASDSNKNANYDELQ